MSKNRISPEKDKFEAYHDERKSKGQRRQSKKGRRVSDTKWFDKMN